MIILCTVPAVDDFANTEAIKLAREVDPEGKRTLVVVTKIDAIQPGMKICEKLRGEGRNVKVAMGMIAVRNRTPTEVEKELPIREARVLERRFFEANPEVRGLEQRYWGTDELVRRIVTVQQRKIDEFIPKIKAKLREELRKLQKELAELAPKFGSEDERRQFFTENIIKVMSRFKDMVYAMDLDNESPELNVPPRTHDLYQAFADSLTDSKVVPSFLSSQYSVKVRDAIKEAQGASLKNFLSHPVFRRLVLKAFSKPIKDAIDHLVSGLRKYVEMVVGALMDEAFQSHQTLLDVMKGDLLPVFLEEKEDDLRRTLDKVARSEKHIFTLNSHYMALVTAASNEAFTRKTAGGQRLAQSQQVAVPPAVGRDSDAYKDFMWRIASSASDDDQVHNMQISLFAYAQVLTNRLSDVVPMLCHESLVTSLYEEMAGFMTESVTQDCLTECLAEDPEVVRGHPHAEGAVEGLIEDVPGEAAARLKHGAFISHVERAAKFLHIVAGR
eukprot:jgi/Mesvir1/13372/Mv05855-RA.1